MTWDTPQRGTLAAGLKKQVLKHLYLPPLHAPTEISVCRLNSGADNLKSRTVSQRPAPDDDDDDVCVFQQLLLIF